MKNLGALHVIVSEGFAAVTGGSGGGGGVTASRTDSTTTRNVMRNVMAEAMQAAFSRVGGGATSAIGMFQTVRAQAAGSGVAGATAGFISKIPVAAAAASAGVVGLIYLVKKLLDGFVAVIKKSILMVTSLAEGGPRLALASPEFAGSFARSTMAGLQRDLRSANVLGAARADALDTWTRFQNAIQPVTIIIERIMLLLGSSLIWWLEKAAKAIAFFADMLLLTSQLILQVIPGIIAGIFDALVGFLPGMGGAGDVVRGALEGLFKPMLEEIKGLRRMIAERNVDNQTGTNALFRQTLAELSGVPDRKLFG